MSNSKNWAAMMGVMMALTVAYCANLGLGLGFWTAIPGWFWWGTDKPANAAGLAILSAAWMLGVVALRLAWNSGRSRFPLGGSKWERRVIVLLVFATALLLPFGYVLLEGKGLDPWRQYLAYVQGACLQRNPLTVIRNYETLVRTEYWFGGFYRTKPPGLAAFYTVFCNIACGLPGNAPNHEDRIKRSVDLLIWIWPVFSAASAVFVGLFTESVLRPLSKRSSPSRDNLLFATGAVLFTSTPAMGVVVMNADQFLYPGLVAMSGVALCCSLDRRRSALGRSAWAVLGASLLWIYCFFYFGLLVAAAGLLGGIGLVLGARMLDGSIPRWDSLRIIVAIAGALCLLTVFGFVVLHYDPLARYRDALATHVAWKGFGNTPKERAYWAFFNLFELAMTAGWPLALLATLGVFGALSEARRWVQPRGALLVIPIALLLLTAWIGKTKGETGRMWIFSLVFMVPLAVERLESLHPRRLVLSASALAGLQVIAAIFLKRFQDFRPH